MHMLARSARILAACACGAASSPTNAGEAALADAAVLLQSSAIVEDVLPAEAPESLPATTYRTRAHERRADREAAHLGAYDALLGALGKFPNMHHSEHILSYVRDKDYGPSVLHGGCLYLPSNEAWSEFYSYVGHPYPPLFAEMVARSFFSRCDAGASSAERSVECTDGRIWGAHKCVEANRVGTVEHQGSTIHLFQTDGHIALPPQWKHHIDLVSQSGDTLRRAEHEHDAGLPKDKCSKSWRLPPVPEGRKLVVPMQFIVCSSNPSHPGINRNMLLDQARWMNVAYSGRSTYSPMDFDHEDIPQADMQMEFDILKKNCTPNAFDDCARIIFAHDKECAEQAFVESKYVARHNQDPFGLFTVVFVGDDKSGILGMAEFPQLDHVEGQRDLVVRVSTTGLRHFASTNKNLKLDTGYDEGDTVVHEAGHSLGLYHTFQGGCALDGDNVADTQPEAYPNYKCTQPKSCGKADPVHNFMDYPEDTCMSGFTELQKRRVWCVFENYRPELYRKSLVISTAA